MIRTNPDIFGQAGRFRTKPDSFGQNRTGKETEMEANTVIQNVISGISRALAEDN